MLAGCDVGGFNIRRFDLPVLVAEVGHKIMQANYGHIDHIFFAAAPARPPQASAPGPATPAKTR